MSRSTVRKAGSTSGPSECLLCLKCADSSSSDIHRLRRLWKKKKGKVFQRGLQYVPEALCLRLPPGAIHVCCDTDAAFCRTPMSSWIAPRQPMTA